MKRLLLTLALCLATLAPVQSAGVLILAQAPAAGCTQSATFLARTSGLSGTETSAYQTMICGMVTDGTWGLLDIFHILATNTTTTAALNLTSTSFSLTTHGTPTFTADIGYTGNGTNFYLDTGWVPSVSGVNFTQSSASCGAYIQTLSTTTSNTYIFGAETTERFSLTPQLTSLHQAVNGTNNTTAVSLNTGQNSQGMWVLNISGASSEALYRNTSSVGTISNATVGLPTSSMLYFINNTGASPSALQASAFYCGAGLTPTQVTLVSNRINAYMAALGVNVY